MQVVDSFDQARELTDGPPYGLAAVALRPDMRHAQRAARELSVGKVKVNAAFGGAPGWGGHAARGVGDGFGYGPELLDELTRVRVVRLEAPPSQDTADLGDA